MRSEGSVLPLTKDCFKVTVHEMLWWHVRIYKQNSRTGRKVPKILIFNKLAYEEAYVIAGKGRDYSIVLKVQKKNLLKQILLPSGLKR